jgi:hypothetical protein
MRVSEDRVRDEVCREERVQKNQVNFTAEKNKADKLILFEEKM